MEKIRGELDRLPLDIGSKNFLYSLSVCIDDYEAPIAEQDYTLIKIDENIKTTLNTLLELVSLDIRQEVIDNSEYLFATDLPLDFERIECHLHNRFSEESCEFSRSVIMGFTTLYGDWNFRYKPTKNILKITTEGIEEISKLRSDFDTPITLDEVDVQFILNQLEESKDDHLFRGINRYYFHNDGVAASIYRNNSDLVKHGKLQDHEKEVVDTLLSKTYYQPEGKSAISALTDLRHSGKDTCLLDFSEDLKIALFFSCQPAPDNLATIGEVLVLDTSEYERKEDIAYPNEEDFLIRPVVTEVTKNRVEAQKSVFLYCHQGYLPREESGAKVKSLLIASRVKPAFYDYCEHTDETVFPDFYSFIEKPENFMTSAKQFCQSKEESEKDYATQMPAS